MDLTAANLIASVVTYVAAITIGLWYLAPAVRARPLADALSLLIWFHAFRHIAMQIFSAGEFGLDASEGAMRTIAFGDLVSAILALIALWALRVRAGGAIAAVWLFALVGTADLISATAVGVSESLVETATDTSWMVLAFYVPFLWVTIVIVFWQLLTRRGESLGESRAV